MSPAIPRLDLGDDRLVMSGSKDVSLTIFIPGMSCRKSLTSFAYRTFHFRKPTGLRLPFDSAKINRKFGCIQCQRSKENSSSREKRKRRVFFCRRTARVKRKVIPTIFLKIVGRGLLVRAEERRKRYSQKN